jgi:hypothetical protein
VRPELLDQLASEASVAPLRGRQARAAGLLGASALTALLLALLWLGARSDIGQAVQVPVFWLKLAFPAALCLLAGLALSRSLHPGAPFKGPLIGLVSLVLVLWLLAWWASRGAGEAERAASFWGTTWLECPAYITALTAPILAAALYWSRGFGPLSPRLTGALAGLASGAFGAALYALHCREPGIPFLATWYLVGAAIPAVAGLALGPSVLAWPRETGAPRHAQP